MTGHIRSIIGQRGQVSPVDNNTVFLAPYDEHAKDILRGVQPIGNKKALSFNGTSTRIQFADTSMFNTNVVATFGSKMSVDMWIWLDQLPGEMSTTYGSIFDSSSDAFVVYLQNNGELRFKVVTSNSTVWVATPQSKLKKQTWFHLACTYDGQNATTYIDGQVATSLAITGNITQSTPVVGFDGTSSFRGKLTNFRVWNKGLDKSEVTRAMNNTISYDNLVTYWKLDETEGAIAYDYSSVGNDGIITAGTWTEGAAVYSLVKDGYPGGMIKYQEATENLVGNVDISSWEKGSVNVVAIGGDEYEVTSTLVGFYIRKLVTVVPSTTYTFSFEAKTGTANVAKYSIYNASALTNIVASTSYSIAEGWQKFSITFTTPAGCTQVGVYPNRDSGVTGSVYIRKPQLEQKSYATEFTPGKRSERKSYGGGVLVEEGTTNLIPTPTDLATWEKSNAIATESNGWFKVQQGIAATTIHGIRKAMTFKGNNTEYSLSFKVKKGNARYVMLLNSSYSAWQNATGNETIFDFQTETFSRMTAVEAKAQKISSDTYFITVKGKTITASATFGSDIYLCHSNGAIGNVTGDNATYFEVSEIQIEEKAFATSFVNGTRGVGKLTYSLPSVIKTMSFWFKPLIPNNYSTYVNWVFGEGNPTKDPHDFIMWKRTTEDYYRVRVRNADYVFSNTDIVQNQWHMITLVATSNSTKVYLNGAYKGTITQAINTSMLAMGWWAGDANSGNNIFDELRIDSIERTDAEIQAWYYQGRNGW